MAGFHISESSSAVQLAEFFGSDPVLYAYHLGDLEPFFAESVRWWIVRSADSPRLISAVTLLYSPPAIPVVQALGDSPAQEYLWSHLAEELPPKLHAHYRSSHVATIAKLYDIAPIGLMQKMRWTGKSDSSQNGRTQGPEILVLSEKNISEIRGLQSRAYPGSYFDSRLLKQGLCVGAYDDSTFVAFGACHVYSETYDVAALGAIMTDPQYRGRGLGRAVTRALITTVSPKVNATTLNVHTENDAAIHLYESLGFVKHCNYEEAILTRL